MNFKLVEQNFFFLKFKINSIKFDLIETIRDR